MAYTSVEGKVSRVFFSGKGAEVTETFTVNGSEKSKRWTAWFDQPHGLSEGDGVKVSGLHSDQIDEWQDKVSGETKRSVKRSLNKARLDARGGNTQQAPSDSVPF